MLRMYAEGIGRSFLFSGGGAGGETSKLNYPRECMKTKNHAEEEELKTPPLAKIGNELRTHSTWHMGRAKLSNKQHQIIFLVFKSTISIKQ